MRIVELALVLSLVGAVVVPVPANPESRRSTRVNDEHVAFFEDGREVAPKELGRRVRLPEERESSATDGRLSPSVGLTTPCGVCGARRG